LFFVKKNDNMSALHAKLFVLARTKKSSHDFDASATAVQNDAATTTITIATSACTMAKQSYLHHSKQ